MNITTTTHNALTTTTYRVGNHVLEVHTDEGGNTGWNISTLWSETQVVRLHANNYLPEITTTVQSASGANITPDSVMNDALEAKTAQAMFTAVIDAL